MRKSSIIGKMPETRNDAVNGHDGSAVLMCDYE